jgi:hypothetical protein
MWVSIYSGFRRYQEYTERVAGIGIPGHHKDRSGFVPKGGSFIHVNLLFFSRPELQKKILNSADNFSKLILTSK